MANKDKLNPGIILVTSYLLLFAASSLVIVLANAMFPQAVVLGTLHIPKVWAIIHSMGTLALFNTLLIPFINQFESARPKPYNMADWLVMYFILNFIGLWLISRFSQQFGLGLSSWFITALLALAMDLVQGFAMMQLERERQK